MSDATKVIRSGGVRTIYIGGGLVCVALAAIGAVVPGMPTTVFVIAASYLFARSCPALDRRLQENRWFGPSLRLYQETGGMPARAKVIAVTSMWSGICLSMVALHRASLGVRLAVVCAGVVGTAVVTMYVRTVPALARRAS